MIVVADHAQTQVTEPLALADDLGSRWRVLQPNQTDPREAELAVCPSSRAAAVYVLCGERRFGVVHAGSATGCASSTASTCSRGSSTSHPGAPRRCRRPAAERLHRGGRARRHGAGFRPGSQVADRRGVGWDLDGDPATLAATLHGDELECDQYPDGLARLWAALTAPHAGRS